MLHRLSGSPLLTDLDGSGVHRHQISAPSHQQKLKVTLRHLEILGLSYTQRRKSTNYTKLYMEAK